ncbi:BolA family protein [Roseobacteraceae bacterium NS-SX3]
MSVSEEIEQRLRAAFDPAKLEVVNDSHRHAGHAGDDGSGESHFSVRIRAQAFAGQSRVQQHRAVHRALGDIVPRIHALALDTGS